MGDLFDDRRADGNIRNSILEVHRYPPSPDELQTLGRFSSLAPTSSARPRKRPLELPQQPCLSQISRNIHGEVPSIEEGDAEDQRPFRTTAKRQRTYESRLNRTSDAHQRLGMREEQGGGPYHSSHTSGTQESIHQVLDSQKSPGKKRTSCFSHLPISLLMYHADPNPYGTPTSLSLIGPQEYVNNNEIDLSAIPDSPLGREATSVSGVFGGAMQLHGESTKSESPELRASIHEVGPMDPIDTSSEQPITSANSPESPTTPFIFNSASQPVYISQVVDQYARYYGLGERQTGEKTADDNRTPKRRPSTADLVHTQTVRSNSKILPNSDPVFDPIESDNESFHEKQQMQSAKRLRSGKTPLARLASPRASSGAGADRRDGQFLVPSVPQSLTNGPRISIGEVTSSGKRENIQKPRRDLKDGTMSVQSGSKRHSKHDAESPEHAQSEPCHDGKTSTLQGIPKKDDGYDNLMSAAKTSSQATTLWSQGSNKSANGTGDIVIHQVDNLMSSREQESDETTRLDHDVNGVVRHPDDDRFAQEAERLAEEAEEQQEKKRVRERKAEKRLTQEAMKKENAAKKEAAERRPNEERLACEKKAKEEKSRADELAQAKQAKPEEQKSAEDKRIEKSKVNAAQLAEEKRASDRLARERQTRETALAEEANKMILAADGAKEIEAEEKEKEKARRREMAAKNQANEAKAAEQAREAQTTQTKDREKKAREERRARENAQELADNEFKDCKRRIHQAGTAQETTTAVKEHGQKSALGQDVQKLKEPSEVQSRASTTTSASSNIPGSKRSMTPVIPGSSVTKSSPHQSSLRSSPSSNRSSGNMDAPLRSALRQTPSSLRRSVSSVSFDVPPRSKFNEYIPSTPNPKSLTEINNELATKTSSAKSLPKTSSRITPNAPLESPMENLIPKRAPDSKITKTSAKTGKVQTKLKVTREVKKLKDRTAKSPITPMQAPKQAIVLSSGEDSSTSEEPVWQTGNAKAGPSSRKPTFPVKPSQEKKTGEVKAVGAPIDPIIRNIKVERDRTAAPATLPRSTSELDMASLQKSTSRSPALALSETFSLSSGSDSDSASNSDSKKALQAPSSKTSTGAMDSKQAPATLKGVSKVADVGFKQPAGHPQIKASSKSSQNSSSRSRSTHSMHGDGKHLDQAADKQLRLESRQSVPSARVEQASSTTNGPPDDKVINQGLDHAGRLPNGIRPAYYKFPALSELQKLPRALTPVVKPKLETSSWQPRGDLSVGKSGTESSSSSSDDSSSNSDENEDVDGVSSQTSSKTKFRRYPGMKGVMKRRSSTPW